MWSTGRIGATHAALHTDDHIADLVGGKPTIGGRATAAALSVMLAVVTTIHQSHIRHRIECGPRDGLWAMEDSLFWSRNGEKQWMRGFGFYHERYARQDDGEWRFTYRRLERLHVETSPGAARLAVDRSDRTISSAP